MQERPQSAKQPGTNVRSQKLCTTDPAIPCLPRLCSVPKVGSEARLQKNVGTVGHFVWHLQRKCPSGAKIEFVH